MLDYLMDLIQNENGQGMVEYGLVLGILASGVILFILTLRFGIEDLFFEILSKISDEISSIVSS